MQTQYAVSSSGFKRTLETASSPALLSPNLKERRLACACSVIVDGIAKCRHMPLVEQVYTFGMDFDANSVRSCAAYSMQGYCPQSTKVNQDSLIVLQHRYSNVVVVACLDGHGSNGDKISAFVKVRLEGMLQSCEFLQQEDVRPVLRSMLVEVEQEIAHLESRMGDYSGTTLVLALLQGSTLTVTNIGDSRIVLGRRKKHKQWGAVTDGGVSDRQPSPSTIADTPSPTLQQDSHKQHGSVPHRNFSARQLSKDHKPDRRDEYDRILASGGRVFSVRYEDGVVGPPRVWLQSSNTPGLAMSRSIGDLVVHTVGVSAEPEFLQMELDPARDRFLVLATDGLWDVMSNEEVVDAVSRHERPEHAVMGLLTESHARWMSKEEMSDDTTICIVRLGGDRC